MKTAHRRLATIGTLAATSVLLSAGAASAHVSVDPGETEKGGYSTVNFKVPNERDNASTVELEVNFPADHPLSSISAQPVPGWDIEITKSKLDTPIEVHGKKVNEAVTKITWSGGEIKPGQFQQFPVSMGQLPEDADRLVFKTLQTYDNDEVVRWIEVPEEGQEEPEHPAPTLQLAAAEDAGAQDDGTEKAAADDAENGEGSESGTENAADSDSSDTTARVLGVLGLIAGIAGVTFGVLAGRRRSA